MELPSSIETEIIDYFNLEYGVYESAEVLKIGDLEYEGEYLVNGKKMRYWKYHHAYIPVRIR